MSPLSWNDVYAGWNSDEFQFYWMDLHIPVLPKITKYLDQAFEEAIQLARNGDDHAKLHLRRIAHRDPNSEQGKRAAIVLSDDAA